MGHKILFIFAVATALIAEGGESGGHVGELTTMVLVPLVADATDLPGMVPVFTVVFFMLASLITYVSGWLTLFPLSYVYGSVEARKKDLERFEAEERELQKL